MIIYGSRVLIGGIFIDLAFKKIKLFTLLAVVSFLIGGLFEILLTSTNRAFNIINIPASIFSFSNAGLWIGILFGIGMYIADKKAKFQK